MKNHKMAALAISFIFWLPGCQFRVDTYLIPAKLEPRWITIEYDNPKCPPLEKGVLSQEFVIPESGFMCTSSKMYMGWSLRKYFLVNEKGERMHLNVRETIRRESTISGSEPSLDAGMPMCKVMAEQFFYGPKEKLTHENPIMEDETFLSYHPECRNRGIVSKPAP